MNNLPTLILTLTLSQTWERGFRVVSFPLGENIKVRG